MKVKLEPSSAFTDLQIQIFQGQGINESEVRVVDDIRVLERIIMEMDGAIALDYDREDECIHIIHPSDY